MISAGRTYIIREIPEGDADGIVQEVQRVERLGHRIADVRHEDGFWRIFAHDRRRFRDDELVGVGIYRRRKDD
jgi:hypothetical protein